MTSKAKAKDDWDDLFPEPKNPIKKKKIYEEIKADDGKNLVILVDGDIVAYRASAPCDGTFYEHSQLPEQYRYKKDIIKDLTKLNLHPDEFDKINTGKNPEPEGYALYNVDRIMEGIIRHFREDACVKVCLTGNQNFRAELNPDYKANRVGQARPVHLNAAKQHLVNHYAAKLEDHLEADDLLGIMQTEYRHNDRESVIVSIDKDLLCVPGRHYNFVKGEDLVMSTDEAMLHFYKQVLTGDNTDNIPGIRGIGPKKAEKILEGCPDDIDMYAKCLFAWGEYMFPGIDPKDYEESNRQEIVDKIQASAQLLWILHEDGVLWTPPIDPMEIL